MVDGVFSEESGDCSDDLSIKHGETSGLKNLKKGTSPGKLFRNHGYNPLNAWENPRNKDFHQGY